MKMWGGGEESSGKGIEEKKKTESQDGSMESWRISELERVSCVRRDVVTCGVIYSTGK